jgi:hypothetical protein
VVPRAERACTRPCGFELSVRRGRLIWTGISQDPKAPLLVGHVDITARIDEHVLRLGDQISRQGPCPLAWLRRDEPAAFHGQQRVLDVIDPQPGIEIGEVDQIARLLDVGKMDLLIDIMRAEPAALLAKIFVWRAFR